MKLKNWLIDHPIFTFTFFTIIWSFTIWSMLLFFIEPGGLMKSPPPISFLFVTLGGFGPAVSGLISTWLVDGHKGLKTLWARVRIDKVGAWWLALLIIPSITALTPLVRDLAGYTVDTQAMLDLLGPGIGLGLGAGLMEEIGWRGFLLPRLLEKHSPLVATLLLGVIWGGL